MRISGCRSGFLFDADADPTFHPDPDPDPDPSFQIKTQTLEKVLKKAYIPYILDCHLQIDADADPDYQNDADPCGSECGSTTLTFT
jgi:hypothetical protein